MAMPTCFVSASTVPRDIDGPPYPAGMVTLQDPLDKILGPKARKPFDEAFEIRTVGDLLRHYPRRYHHRGELTDLASLHEGEHVTVLAQVVTPEHGRWDTARARSSRSPSPTVWERWF